MSAFTTTSIETMNSSINFPVIELTMASITIFVFVILAFLMLCMIIHLLHKTYTKRKNKPNKSKKLIFFLCTTVCSLCCFEMSLCLTITVVIQLFLLDDVIKSNMISSTFFFQTYHIFEYFIALLDSAGHLSMLLIFIARFQYVFDNEIFNQSKWLIRSLYTMLSMLSFIALFVILYVIPSQTDKSDLLLLEIIWEICVESSIVFILFLFISNLYKLLQFSLSNHLKKNGNPKDLLSEITKQSLETSKSSHKKGSNNGGTKSKKSNKIVLTIDGIIVDPLAPSMTNKSGNLSPNSPITSLNKSSDVDAYQSDAVTDNEDNDNATTTGTANMRSFVGYSQTMEILTVMSKMTLLVIIAAIGSFLTIIGNFIIESHGAFNEKDLSSDEGLDHDAIWVFILPVADMFITSLMLYLQFNFTHKMYRVMCHCLDSVFLRCLIGIIGYCWRLENEAPVICEVDDCKPVKELQTKSTVSTAPSNPMPMTPTYDDIQIQMQTMVR